MPQPKELQCIVFQMSHVSPCYATYVADIHHPWLAWLVFMTAMWLQANFPADFVAEGLDQTRGWFYTLMVLSTALFDKPAFKNLVCNGLILAADGKKMSKRLKNYPVRIAVLEPRKVTFVRSLQ